MSIANLIRWPFSVAFTLLGCWIIIQNFRIVYVWYARREHHSWVPLLGGFLGFIGMGLCPLRAVERFAWLPLAVDCGYIIVVMIAAIFSRTR